MTIDNPSKFKWEIGGIVGAITVIGGVTTWLLTTGATYGTLKATVDGDHADISAVKATLQNPNNPEEGLVPMLNRMNQRLIDIHNWTKP
jgi:hypothetical protein